MDISEQREQRTRELTHWSDPHSDVLSIVDGSGVRVRDEAGDEYLDYCSQLYCTNLGHDNEAIAAAVTDQLGQIPYVSSAKRSPVREELAGRLADIAPGDLSDTFFSISGSEANEIAVHLAREYTGANKVLTRWRSYHGATYGAASLTGDPETRAVLERHAQTTGTARFLPPIPRAFDADDPEQLAKRAADHLEFVIRNEGRDSIAAVLTEPVAGTSGAFVGPADYFQRVRDICDEHDILLISDEVIAGFGRCGEWFGIETEDVVPDMLTFAKGATGAYVPLAGVVTPPEISDMVAEQGLDIGQTFGGHPVACAAGVAAIDAYDDGVIENVRENEAVLRDGLSDLEARYDVVHDTHGRGFQWGVEFADPETGEPFHDPRGDDGDNPVMDVLAECREHGVLFGSGRPAIQVILSPPLVATAADLHDGIEVLEAAIDSVFD
jgi:taurine--2-oxoglutarate transaminase